MSKLIFRRACGIHVDNEVIVIGGQDSLNSVRVYNENGLVETLPDINVGRYGAACGYYLDNLGLKVLREKKNLRTQPPTNIE